MKNRRYDVVDRDWSAMNEQPAPPGEALNPEELQRFLDACSQERRSPTTQRTIDGASYTWIHNFIRTHSDEAPGSTGDWLDLGVAHPDQLGSFFSRVATRAGHKPAGGYAAQLGEYFEVLNESLQEWPESD